METQEKAMFHDLAKENILHTIGDITVDFDWSRNRLFDKAVCEDYLLLCLSEAKAKVEKVITKPKHKWRPTPLDTVEMEKLGSRKLKISAKETMMIAEKLYSKGIISYPRTETNQFSKDIDLSGLVENFVQHPNWGAFARRIIEWGPSPRNGNKTDQAHPPIHPIKLVTDLQGNDARVYELVCCHFLACVSKDAVGSETLVNISVAGEKFTATGLRIHERNYLDIYIYEKWNAKEIHEYEEGQTFDPTEISMHEGATIPPPLLTEADLIALMEKHGIGTDATHAEHINTIKERGYIGVVEKGRLVPGIIGMGLYEGYDAMDLALAKPMLRAVFESDLRDICSGKKDPKAVLMDQVQIYLEAYRQITEKMTALDDKMALRINELPRLTDSPSKISGDKGIENVISNVVKEIFQCPKCLVAPLALRQKKDQNGHYIGCMNFPDCKNVIWLSEDCQEPRVLHETCQHCGPSVKQIKLKFKSLYYKSLFKTPSGWYKTCLRCDQQFRENFNINIEKVKPSGGIVCDVTSSTKTTSSDGRMFVCGTSAGIQNCEITPGNALCGNPSHPINLKEKMENCKPCLNKNKVSSRQIPTKKQKTTLKLKCERDFSTTELQSDFGYGNRSTPSMDMFLDEFLNCSDDFDTMMSAIDLPVENVANAAPNKVKNTTSSFNNEKSSFHQVNFAYSRKDIFYKESSSDPLNEMCDVADFPWGTAEHRIRCQKNRQRQKSRTSRTSFCNRECEK